MAILKLVFCQGIVPYLLHSQVLCQAYYNTIIAHLNVSHLWLIVFPVQASCQLFVYQLVAPRQAIVYSEELGGTCGEKIIITVAQTLNCSHICSHLAYSRLIAVGRCQLLISSFSLCSQLVFKSSSSLYCPQLVTKQLKDNTHCVTETLLLPISTCFRVIV